MDEAKVQSDSKKDYRGNLAGKDADGAKNYTAPGTCTGRGS
jgi:hypothetical protein